MKQEIASRIGLSAPTFSKILNANEDKQRRETWEKVLKPILVCLYNEGNLANDEMKKRVDKLLYSIFRQECITNIIKHFKIQLENNGNDVAKTLACGYCHGLMIEEIFGNLEQTRDISYADYFIDDKIIVREMEDDIVREDDMLFNECRAEDDSKRYVVIFDVKMIDREFLHQRIRCMQRKDNVFAVLVVEKGECYDDKKFYRNEHSNIMWIEYQKVGEEDSKICSYNYLEGTCLSWYDKKCKALMTEGIDKIIVSHK